MRKTKELIIEESIEELNKTKRKCTSIKEEKRLRMLISFKEDKNIDRVELALDLKICKRTLERWIKSYRKEGLLFFQAGRTRIRSSKIINASISKGLEDRVKDPNASFKSYIDAQQWVLEEYGESINYHTLRWFLTKKFGTKLKSPRKSHIKKDPEAVEAFLKNPESI